MKIKKILSMALSALICLTVATGCSKAKTDNVDGNTSSASADWDYIANKGELVIGITLYEPMNYYDENGKLIGFDTEFAELVCSKLGVTPKFQVIEWEQKEMELKSKAIDCIWNGLTVTEDRKANMAFSTPYVKNKQVAIIKSSNAEKYISIDNMAGVSVTAESGSAGDSAIKENKILAANKFIPSSAQKDVLMEVKAGTTEVGIIDYVMANATIGEGTDYSDLMIVESVELAPEEYAIGLRLEDTATVEKINGAISEVVADGSLKALADKYDLTDVFAFN